MKTSIAILTFLCILNSQDSIGQVLPEIELNDFDRVQEIDPKPLVLFVEADWCKYCAAMHSNMASDSVIQHLTERYYYLCSIDQSLKESVQLFGVNYDYIPSGNGVGSHELFHHLESISNTHGVPGLFVLDAKGELLFSHVGFLNKSELRSVFFKFAVDQNANH